MYDRAAAGIDRTPSEPRCGPFSWTTAAFRKDAGQKALICAGFFESGWGTWIRTKILGVRVRPVSLKTQNSFANCGAFGINENAWLRANCKPQKRARRQ